MLLQHAHVFRGMYWNPTYIYMSMTSWQWWSMKTTDANYLLLIVSWDISTIFIEACSGNFLRGLSKRKLIRLKMYLFENIFIFHSLWQCVVCLLSVKIWLFFFSFLFFNNEVPITQINAKFSLYEYKKTYVRKKIARLFFLIHSHIYHFLPDSHYIQVRLVSCTSS